jgi:hypothetical protein
MQELIGFGYWRSLYEPTLPDPEWFVDAHWAASTRQAVLNYLQQGHPLLHFMGYSWCRFRCGTANGAMGTADLTDGTYCWPEGLRHYLLKHAVRLPEPLVQHILAQPVFPHSKAAQASPTSPTTLTWWATQIGWNPTKSSFLSESDEEIRAYVRRFDSGRMDFSDYSTAGLEAIERMVQQLRDINNL